MTEPTISELQAQIEIYDEKFRASEARVLSLMEELRNEGARWFATHARECAKDEEIRLLKRSIKELRLEITDKSHFYDANCADLSEIIDAMEPAWVLGFSDPIPNDPIRNLRLS